MNRPYCFIQDAYLYLYFGSKLRDEVLKASPPYAVLPVIRLGLLHHQQKQDQRPKFYRDMLQNDFSLQFCLIPIPDKC